AQRSISTKTTGRLRSGLSSPLGNVFLRGERMPRRLIASIAMRTPRIWPAQRWPWASSASWRSSSSSVLSTVAALMTSMLRLLLHRSENDEECDGSVAVVADRGYLSDLSAQLSGYGWRWRGRPARNHGAAGLPGRTGRGCDLDFAVLSVADEGFRLRRCRLHG